MSTEDSILSFASENKISLNRSQGLWHGTNKRDELDEEYDSSNDTDVNENNKVKDANLQKFLGFLGIPRSHRSAHGLRRALPGPWWWVFNLGLFLLTSFAIWRLATPPRTDLRDYIKTDDGKPFPSGQLTWSQKFTPLPCGKSPSEALSRGCHFDIIATAWLPPRCIDYDLISEFLALYPWKYYNSRDGTSQLSDDPDTLGSNVGRIWTTNRWHSAHCLFMWKKLNRALVQGRFTDGETIKQAHTDHCSNTILNTKHLDSIGSLMEIIYPPC